MDKIVRCIYQHNGTFGPLVTISTLTFFWDYILRSVIRMKLKGNNVNPFLSNSSVDKIMDNRAKTLQQKRVHA